MRICYCIDNFAMVHIAINYSNFVDIGGFGDDMSLCSVMEEMIYEVIQHPKNAVIEIKSDVTLNKAINPDANGPLSMVFDSIYYT